MKYTIAIIALFVSCTCSTATINEQTIRFKNLPITSWTKPEKENKTEKQIIEIDDDTIIILDGKIVDFDDVPPGCVIVDFKFTKNGHATRVEYKSAQKPK